MSTGNAAPFEATRRGPAVEKRRCAGTLLAHVPAPLSRASSRSHARWPGSRRSASTAARDRHLGLGTLGVAVLWRLVAVRGAPGARRLRAARGRAGRPRGGAPPGHRSEPATRVARVQLRRPRRRRARRRWPGFAERRPRRGARPLRPRQLRPAGHRQLAAGRMRRRRHRRPPERGRPDTELRRRAAVRSTTAATSPSISWRSAWPGTAHGSPSSGVATSPATSTDSVPRSATTSSRIWGSPTAR